MLYSSFSRHSKKLFSIVLSRIVCRSSCTSSTQRWSAGLTTLAIETSCDDTSIAVLSINGTHDQSSKGLRSDVRFHQTVTAQSHEYKGIHPLVALASHQENIGALVSSACSHLGDIEKPTFVSVTRGPGIRSNLSVGLDVAKGLALAWNVPLVGVHHMQAHALTPRLCGSMLKEHDSDDQRAVWHDASDIEPRFPYLTLLVSGGHTTLLRSESLVQHDILAETLDIAIGDCLDKAARVILPPELLTPPYGRALEHFAFPNGAQDYGYEAPETREGELKQRETKWGWSLAPPFSAASGRGNTARTMAYSFSGLLTAVERIVQRRSATQKGSHSDTGPMSIEERRDLARECLRVTFEHLVSRLVLYYLSAGIRDTKTIVISGGVASNQYLRHVFRQFLAVRGFRRIKTLFPPIELCTDNALMIAWAGMEMYMSGYSSGLEIAPIRRWSMDPSAEDGGILGVGGWNKR